MNYSSTHTSSMSIWTDKVNPLLDWSWCLHWKNELQTCRNAKSLLKAAVKFLTQGLRVFHLLYTNWENTCRLYYFREVIWCLTFCSVSWKEETSLPSFTLQRSFWMPFAVQPTMAPYLISTCCFSSSEENCNSGRLHVFTTREMGKAPVTFITDQLRQSGCPWFLMSSAWHSAEYWQD